MKSIVIAMATVLSFAAVQASAAVVNITGITSSWTATTGTTASGIGTNQIRWGAPATDAGQSGYNFMAATTPINNIAPATAFDLGTFAHLNNPIFAPSITSASLKLIIDITVGGSAHQIVSNFVFDHEETPNNDVPCAYGGDNFQGDNINGCADRVTAALNPSTSTGFFIGLDEYLFTIKGFEVDGDLFTEFLTTERMTNTASLQGIYTLKSNVPPIPLPAAGWLLISALVGMGALARRRKAA